jgi:hypothetical protein
MEDVRSQSPGKSGIEDCLEKIGFETTRSHISMVARDISGGRISRAEIDEIRSRPTAREISISGLRQDTFEYLVATYGPRFRVLNFWKCPLVESLARLGGLPGVEYVTWYWNQRVVRLWDMSGNASLKGVALRDFSRLHGLDGIERAPALEELLVGDAIWTKFGVDSLEPLAHCRSLRWLSLAFKKIRDGRIEPLARIRNLQYLDLPRNQFTTEQFAWLRARLPAGVASAVLAAYERIDDPLVTDAGKILDTLIIGKRKPMLSWNADRPRIDRYAQAFASLVRHYAEDATAGEPAAGR